MSKPIADFSSVQAKESQVLRDHGLVLAVLNQVNWFVEFAPITSPSPQIGAVSDKHRVLFDGNGLCWPVRALGHALPFDDGSVPAVLIRYAWQPTAMPLDLTECFRVLKPGGWWISVSANPWHPRTWQGVGKHAMRLPSWPQLLWAHTHLNLQLKNFTKAAWSGMPIGFSPVLVVVGQKPNEIAPLSQSRRHRIKFRRVSGAVAHCEAA